MEMLDAAGREYWRGVLVAGGVSAIPRWTLDPTPGAAEHLVQVPDELRAALAGPGLLAAHAAVLAALTGEADVTAGYVAAPGGRPLPVRLDTGAGSWRELVDRAGRAEAVLSAHRDFPVQSLRRELGVPGPRFETVLDPTGTADGTGEALLTVGVTPDGAALRLRYRSEVMDGEAAARIAGYHLRAVELMVADPGAEHRTGTVCCRPRSCGSRWRGWPGRCGSCRIGGSTSCSRRGCGPIRMWWPRWRVSAAGPTGS